MAKPAGAKPKPFRRARLGIASLVALGLGALTAGAIRFTEPGQTLDLAVSDYLRSANTLDEAVLDRVVTIEIDDRSVEHPVHQLYLGARDPGPPPGPDSAVEGPAREGSSRPSLLAPGRWPWNRPKQGDFIEALASLGPRFIALDIEYPDYEGRCVGYRPTADGGLDTFVDERPDERLRDSLARTGNVLVPFSLYYRPGGNRSEPPARDAGAEVPAHLLRHAIGAPLEGTDRLLAARQTNPMIRPLAEVAAGSGFTSLHAKDPDQAVRRVPLLTRVGRHVFPHLGLEMAGLRRFGPDYGIRLERGRLRLTSADGSLWVSVPVDAKAQLNLRWPKDIAAARRDCISAGPFLGLLYYRVRLWRHEARWRLIMEELDALVPGVDWAEARRALDAAVAATGRSALDLAQDPDAAAHADLEPLRDRLARLEERLVMDTMSLADRPEAAEAGPQAARAVARYQTFISTYHQRRDEMLADLRRWSDRLRPVLAGKAVIVGVATTAGTDFHKTPISEQQPGVEVYPAVMRTILSGVAFRRLAPWSEWVMGVLAAWLVGVLATRLPTGWAVAATVWMAALVLGGAYLAAGSVAVLLPVAGPVLAVVVAFAGVSGYRQLTEASSRRWITRVFEQYTSPAHVEEIIENPDALRLGGDRREITVLFSDIAGFTPLSERMDPEQLVALLQHYLGAMTAILYSERATLDKYEGDGIMAFVGAPVQVQDHALRAVRAALAMQDAMPRINEDLLARGLLEPGTPLCIRIGCSSGPANVGNFGSETRFDYTAMGDTVNLGGRLEEANRWLGTRILVPETTRRACGEAVLFRPLGPARIRGKTETVNLWEPLALEPAPAGLRETADAFRRAIQALQAGDLDAADTALDDLLAADPPDEPAQALHRRIRALRSGSGHPTDPWDLARPK